jgi:hypothetical protein
MTRNELLADWNAVADQWDVLAGRYIAEERRERTIDAYCRCANQAHDARGEMIFVLHSDDVKPFSPGVVERALMAETAKLKRAVASLAKALDNDISLARPRPRDDSPPTSLRLLGTVAEIVEQYGREHAS